MLQQEERTAISVIRIQFTKPGWSGETATSPSWREVRSGTTSVWGLFYLLGSTAMEAFSDQTTISSGGGVWGTIRETLLYLQQNAWTIVFALGSCYLVKVNVLDPWMEGRRQRASLRVIHDPTRVSSLQEDMRRVRAAQQEEAARLAQHAEEARRTKKREAMEQKRVKTPLEAKGGLGHRFNNDTTATSSNSRSTDGDGGGGGYNPMNPSSGFSNGYRYAYMPHIPLDTSFG
eukprot:scaffold23255_cov59-Attheya_sp.AAC.2